MFSGGLDSILAIRAIQEQGIEVLALHFYNGFNDAVQREVERRAAKPWSPTKNVCEAAEKLGITLVPVDVTEGFEKVFLNPSFGYGSAANPCIDCRIFLLGQAKEIMDREDASFIFTGEVVGQRPMSQYKNIMRAIEKRCGFEGRLLRPLSAKLLPPTIPEQEGIVDRDRLYDFRGRSRHPQFELAKQFGIDYYPSSGGGCMLTTIQFGNKFDDMMAHTDGDTPDARVLRSLLVGRHMRTAGGIKVVMGRKEAENDYLVNTLGSDYWRFSARDFTGPDVYAIDEPDEAGFLEVAAITARYGKGRDEQEVAVIAERGEDIREILVTPATAEDTDPLLLGTNE
jgi:tRNA-uridine 2-sulfurtransferase